MTNVFGVLDSTYGLAFLTWIPCGTIVFVAICRLNSMQQGVLWRVKLEYSLYLSIGVGVILAPIMGEWPGAVIFFAMCALALAMLCSSRAWRGDRAPDEATDYQTLQPARRRVEGWITRMFHS